MFKKFFKSISNSIKNCYHKIKKSKMVKFISSVLSNVCKGSLILTAFNAGSITEALAHMNDGPTNLADTARWMVAMCTEFMKDVKAKNFNWEVKFIFAPLVISTVYIGKKLIGKVKSIAKWFSSASKAMNTPKKTEPKATTEVVNLFA